MTADRHDLTTDDLRARMRVAGITIAENRLPMVRKLLADALRPLRTLDSRAIGVVEPAVRFAPAGAGAPREDGVDDRGASR